MIPLTTGRCRRGALKSQSIQATELSLEEQQKLCIARLIPVKPVVMLMDEPCSALDPKGTEAVEELIWELADDYTIVIPLSTRFSHAPVFAMGSCNRFGEAADSIRNKKMLEVYKPEFVIAFPGGAGTEDMVRRAKAAGVEVFQVGATKEQEI